MSKKKNTKTGDRNTKLVLKEAERTCDSDVCVFVRQISAVTPGKLIFLGRCDPPLGECGKTAARRLALGIWEGK